MHTRTIGSRLGGGLTIILVGAVVIGVLLFARMALNDKGATPTDLTPEDISRLGMTLEPLASTEGLLTARDILALALKEYDPPDPDARVDAFLYAVTDPGSARSDRPLRGTPVWIVHYSGITVTSPGGKTLHHAYDLYDARTGEFLRGTWSP